MALSEKGDFSVKDVDKYRGCLIGGAVGDALGYAVEFLPDSAIFQRYGERGITKYELIDGVAQISDDTQMTLFTANGLLLGTSRRMAQGDIGSYPFYIGLCYKDWLKTQSAENGRSTPAHAWLNHIPAMNNARAPGGTCLDALSREKLGSIEEPTNNSKGCGGVMRVAPIGLYFGEECQIDEIDKIGAETAALTHGHELGYIPAAMLVHIVHLLAHNCGMSILEAVQDAEKAMMRLFKNARHLRELLDLVDKAIAFSVTELDDLDAIRKLGEGWVAEEALAIAVYCALKYQNDFERAIIAAVNHSGDSDSTGAVTGNILGAHLGINAIPEKFLTHLELKDIILEMADDLFHDRRIPEHGDCRTSSAGLHS